jgi:O-antigen/teichoic acid export membrane protein
MLFLAYPVYAVAVVLSAFLVFSGLGSYAADRRLAATEKERRKPLKLVRVAVLLIAAVGGAYLVIIPVVFRAAASWPDPGRVALSLLLLSPLAFFMGIPFPAGLQLVSDRRGRMVPWAWGLNGAASVLGATLATLLAIHLGFGAVVVLAFACYAAAAIALGGIHGWTEET